MSRVLVFVSLLATLTLGAHAEWKVGVAIGLSVELAAVLPVAIDSYVLAALIAERDVKVALTILALSIGGGHVLIGFDVELSKPMKAAVGGVVGLVVVAVLWRVEELAKQPAPVQPDATAAVTATVLPTTPERPEITASDMETPPPPPVRPRVAAARATAAETAARTTAKAEPELSEADLETGREIAAELAEAKQSVTVRALTAGFRERGQSLSSDRAAALARALRA